MDILEGGVGSNAMSLSRVLESCKVVGWSLSLGYGAGCAGNGTEVGLNKMSISGTGSGAG